MAEPVVSGPAEPEGESDGRWSGRADTDGPLLEVRGLTIGLRRRRATIPLVHGVDLRVERGERLGLVGESGSGKSLTMLAVMGLLAPPLEITGGSIRLAGRELVGADRETLRSVRGPAMGMIYQDPMTSLDPMLRVGPQVAEGLVAHGEDRRVAAQRARDALSEVGLGDPAVARLYPHELSGGMRQRVMIASALVAEPRLLIADEPTTALDVTVQRQILRLVASLQARRGMAVVWATHDLGVVAQFADRVAVMYAGRVVESAPTRALFAGPEHPYSAALLSSIPRTTSTAARMPQIRGLPPDPARLPSGCAFHPRCRYADERCRTRRPEPTPRDHGGVAACHAPPATWPQRDRDAVG